jgi:hypothetical protein
MVAMTAHLIEMTKAANINVRRLDHDQVGSTLGTRRQVVDVGLVQAAIAVGHAAFHGTSDDSMAQPHRVDASLAQ